LTSVATISAPLVGRVLDQVTPHLADTHDAETSTV
jgi:hypothetical protein